mmetsp:Transcript_21429/g.44043  ORF Transcript_21429/g.44043 Transcript_21429/m.44043 type:complete len:84 (-) Transcript_21429:436-687(-)
MEVNEFSNKLGRLFRPAFRESLDQVESFRSADGAVDVMPRLTRSVFFTDTEALSVSITLMITLKGSEERVLPRSQNNNHREFA